LEKNINDLNISLSQFNKKIEDENEKTNHFTNLQQELENKIEILKGEKAEADKVRDLCKFGINELEKELLEQRKNENEDKSHIEELKRAKELLNKELCRAENNKKKQNEEEEAKRKLIKEKEIELKGLAIEEDKKLKQIAILEREKEKFGIQAAQANAKYFHSIEESKLKDNLISEFQKKNLENDAKLKQQQNLYEAVRSDLNLYSKNLAAARKQVAEIEKKYKLVNHQISQFKEEIETKGNELAQEHFEHKEKDKIIDQKKNEIDLYKSDNVSKDNKIKEQVQIQFIAKNFFQLAKRHKEAPSDSQGK